MLDLVLLTSPDLHLIPPPCFPRGSERTSSPKSVSAFLSLPPMSSQLNPNKKTPCTIRVTKRKANKSKTKKDLLTEDLQAFVVSDKAPDPDRGFIARRSRVLSDGESDVETSKKAKRARGELRSARVRW